MWVEGEGTRLRNSAEPAQGLERWGGICMIQKVYMARNQLSSRCLGPTASDITFIFPVVLDLSLPSHAIILYGPRSLAITVFRLCNNMHILRAI